MPEKVTGRVNENSTWQRPRTCRSKVHFSEEQLKKQNQNRAMMEIQEPEVKEVGVACGAAKMWSPEGGLGDRHQKETLLQIHHAAPLHVAHVTPSSYDHRYKANSAT